jgi:hypothetical protein
MTLKHFFAGIKIPGVVWVALILGLVPIIQAVLPQYTWVAGVVMALELLAKLVQMYLDNRKSQAFMRSSDTVSTSPPNTSQLKTFLFG